MNRKAVFNTLSFLIVFLGLFMLLAAAWAVYYQDGDLWALLVSSAICLAVGIPGYFTTRGRYALAIRDGFAIVTLGWLSMAIFASLPFFISRQIPSFTDSFFETMSGLTTTGATILGDVNYHPHLPNGIESMPHGLLFWRAFIQWIGGMGIIMFSVAILPFMGVGGASLYRAEVPGPTIDRIQPRMRETAKTLWWTYLFVSAAEVFLLKIGGLSWFSSLTHTCTTMATGGFSVNNDSIFGQTAFVQYIIIFHVVLTQFGLIGQLDFSGGLERAIIALVFLANIFFCGLGGWKGGHHLG